MDKSVLLLVLSDFHEEISGWSEMGPLDREARAGECKPVDANGRYGRRGGGEIVESIFN